MPTQALIDNTTLAAAGRALYADNGFTSAHGSEHATDYYRRFPDMRVEDCASFAEFLQL